MTGSNQTNGALPASLPKTPTGIAGLDEITGGGLPRGRPTLVCGAAGCGKTLLSVEFLVQGATRYGEPGVFIAFEETAEELAQNVRSLGFDLEQLVAERKLALDYIHLERSEIEETGEYDLEGLFIRLGHAIDTIGARRVVLDTIETIFSGLSNTAILRAELRRLFRFLKERGVTAIVTGERGEGGLTRNGLEEYVSDCVILLDHRVIEQVSTRRLRIVKYRGSTHGTNEYPFLIDEHGLSVLPITSLGFAHQASNERIGTGVPQLDAMLGGGIYRGSSILISGTAGTGKTSLAAHFAAESCRRGERCIYFAFEESPSQLCRNMRSIGLDLEAWTRTGLLQILSQRPTLTGLEMHLLSIHREIEAFQPALVILDPISNFTAAGSLVDVSAMLMRLVDALKARQITLLLTNLNVGGHPLESTDVGISSLIDTWLLVRDVEAGGERNRGLHILKSRGTAHSNQIREFILSERGLELLEVCVGPAGALTGSLRLVEQARVASLAAAKRLELERHKQELELKRRTLEAQVAGLRSQFAEEEAALQRLLSEEQRWSERLAQEHRDITRNREVVGARLGFAAPSAPEGTS